jgi:hypothetical protein
MSVSGPLESVNIAGRRFAVDGEVDAAIALAGFTNEVKPNGDGSFRLIKSRKAGRVNTIPIQMDDTRDDEEYIQRVMDLTTFPTMAFTKVDGTVYKGAMQIVEDPETSTKEGTKELSFMGSLGK